MVTRKSDRAPSSVHPPTKYPEGSGRRFNQRFSGFALVLLGTIIVGVLALAPGLRNLVEQRQQIADLQTQVAGQQQQVSDLKDQAARWDDPAYIRAQTRQRLFFVVPGEKSFVIIDDVNKVPGQADATTAAPTTEITTTHYDWRQLLAESVYSAATSTDKRSDASK